jgi:hypothetical protein
MSNERIAKKLLGLAKGIINNDPELIKFGIWELRDGLTFQLIKKRNPWLLEADIEVAEIGQNKRGQIIWYSGSWCGGIFKGDTWVDGAWRDGDWKGKKWHEGYDATTREHHGENDSPDKWDLENEEDADE